MDKTEGRPNGSGPPPGLTLREEIQSLVESLREEVIALRKEVTALRRKESPDGPDALLSREEAADRFNISTRTLDDMAATGEIQPIRIRGRVLYHPKALEAYVRRAAGEGRQ
jgi:excisionase family DNA binding protein